MIIRVSSPSFIRPRVQLYEDKVSAELAKFLQPENRLKTHPISICKPSMDSGPRDLKARRSRRARTPIEMDSVSTSRTSLLNEDIDENLLLARIRRTSRQKSRGFLDDSWQNGLQGSRLKTTCPVTKYSIVASKGELSRTTCGSTESLTASLLTKRSSSTLTSRAHGIGRSLFQGTEEDLDLCRARRTKGSSRTIPKSASVPANLKEGFQSREKSRTSEDSILKKSSSFLANLAHTAGRISERKSSEINLKTRDPYANGYRQEVRAPKNSLFKGYFSILSGVTTEVIPLRKSPSVQTLPTGWKKKSGGGVKKSVSFSSDTSFEEKRAPFRKAAVHEAKVYHKGVLQDRGGCAGRISAKVPPSWESPVGGRSALLRAARDADDAILTEIVSRVRKLGLGEMDVNMTDGSGRYKDRRRRDPLLRASLDFLPQSHLDIRALHELRPASAHKASSGKQSLTAISYMAGNGASAMLEVALSLEGADPNIPDNEGNTPLHFAAQAGQTECLNILLQRCPEIEVDARNSSGFTPLMKAALQGRAKCAKILLFAGANPTLRDHGRGLRAEQWARFCGRYICAEMIERFARHKLLERTTSCRWGSEPELAAKVLQGKVTPIPPSALAPPSTGLKSKIRRVFRTTSGPDRNFSLITQLTSAALCASSPALPKSGDVPPMVKSLLRPLSVPQLRVTLVSPQDFREKAEKFGTKYTDAH